MKHNTLPENCYEPVFVARQPIFDARQNIWGYELLFRHTATSDVAHFSDPDKATARVIADGYTLATAGMSVEKRLLINFPRNLLLDDTLYALPSNVCVIEILETVQPEDEIVAALQKAKDAGYMLALDDYTGEAGFEPLLELADIVKVEVLHQSKEDIERTTDKLRNGKARLLAEKVEDRESFEFLRELGYELFQGFYFSKPEIVPGRKISSANLSRLQLLQELSKSDYEVKDLAAIISRDVSISYRLLSYLNSAAFGLRNSIETIHQAITILGTRSTRQWLMVVILSDLDPSPRAEALTLQSIHRARFLQLAARQEPPRTPLGEERMFLLGLLSLLDALLGHSMEELIGKMLLDQQMKDALLGVENMCLAWLDLVRAIENAEWRRAVSLLHSCGMEQGDAALLHATAGVWANEVVSAAQQR